MAHLYWRISITAVVAGTSSAPAGDGPPALAEVVFYDSSGTPISTASGTASSNAPFNPFVFGGGSPAAAFDGNSSTSWCINEVNATPSAPIWLRMQFPSPVAVDHFSLTFSNTVPANCPANFSLQYSDDGSAWTTVYSYQGGLRVTGLYTNTFYTSGVVYRLSATAVQSGAQSSFSNIKFFDGSGTLITGPLGNGFNSSWDGGLSGDGADPTQSYNNTCSSWFTTFGTPSSGSPEWVGFQFSSASVASLSFQSANWPPAGIADTPTVFSIQRSTDGLNFTTIASFASASWTTACQTQTFSIVAPTRSITASPSIGVQCRTETVTITGSNTHFVNGTTIVAMSGTGATVSAVSVSSSTSLTFSLALSCTAALGVRTITVTTGSESDAAPFVVEAGPTIASLLQGNIAWAQIRLGFNGRFGTGMYGASTDGTGSSGVIPVWGGADGQTLTAGGPGSISSGFLTTYVASTPVLDSSGNPILDANANWIF